MDHIVANNSDTYLEHILAQNSDTYLIIYEIVKLKDIYLDNNQKLKDEITALREEITGLRDEITGLREKEYTNLKNAGKTAKQAGIMGAIFGLGTDIATIGSAGGFSKPPDTTTKDLTNTNKLDDN